MSSADRNQSMESVPLPSTALVVSCHSDTHIKKQAFKQISMDISTLRVKILSMKKLHNSLNITARLPNEVLARIFVWNVPEYQRDNHDWHHVAAVCSAWREIALGSPRLWGFIGHRGVNWITQVLLPRSQSVPLSIIVDLEGRASLQGLRLALDEMHRIRVLSLTEHYVAHVRMMKLLSGLNKPAPVLEDLTIDAIRKYGRDVYRLPDDLFDNFAPNLRRLVLKSCIIPIESYLLSTLTTLALGAFRSPNKLCLLDLSTLLRAASNVEDLTLRNVFQIDNNINNSDSNTWPASTPDIRLPHLRRLLIEESPLLCTVLMSCISSHNIERLEVVSKVYNLGDVATRLRNQLSRFITSVTAATIPERLLHHFPIELHGRRDGDEQLSAQVVLYLNLFANSFPETMDAITAIVPLIKQIQSLDVQHAQLPQNIWAETFGDCNLLSTVRIKGNALEFLEAILSDISYEEVASLYPEGDVPEDESTLTDVTSDSDDANESNHSPKDVTSRFCFPSLRIIHMTAWNSYTSGLDPSRLALALRFRALRGSPIEELSIRDCTHYSTTASLHVERIREMLGSSLVWDVTDGSNVYIPPTQRRKAINQTRRLSDTPSEQESSVPDSERF